MNEPLPLIAVTKRNAARVAAKVRGRSRDVSEVEKIVEEIVAKVRLEGDKALLMYSRTLDRAEIGGALRVSGDDLTEAAQTIDAKLSEALRFSLGRIRRTQGQLLRRLSYTYVANGFVTRSAPRPISSVGCYIPGGRASYASTVLMTAGVAKLAGVKRVVLCTPPDPQGRVSGAVLAAAQICGVDEVYRVGGAHSIAALGYGTETIPKVDKIVGPGGIYVSVAKRLISRDVPIDFFAGPTELVVVGDETADPRLVAWDLVGQAEHGEDSLCGFVTWDEGLARKVRREAALLARGAQRESYVRGALDRGFTALCSDREAALALVNAVAPEHLEVMVKDARSFSEGIENAGLVLLGKYAPCAASDYCIGTDHVIPTQGYAALRGGLSVFDFLKLSWTTEGTKEGLKATLPSLEALAKSEGLPNHYESAAARFKR
ncbi:MAG: histidinol dehydrogenase [Thaumarchaeota archaeon]|nr:histidinol dehydrogenase [Nitrososphaerota archaeon]